MLKDEFFIEGLRYRLVISDAGNVAFGLIGGASRKGNSKKRGLDLFPDEPRIDDCDLVASGFTVLIAVKKRILNWVHKSKPWCVSFSAATGRKFYVYRRVALQVAKNLQDYNLVIDGNTFMFYRLSSRQAT